MMRVLITGAAGSGTSTLGEALAKRWNARFLEADAYFWLPTQPPFTHKRPPNERGDIFYRSLQAQQAAVVAGSVVGWGTEIENAFNLVVFLHVPTEIRLQRIERREIARYGRVNPAFLDWAAQYDAGSMDGRSLQKHNTWLASRQCPVIRLVGDHSVADLLSLVEQQVPNPLTGTSR